MTDKKNDYFHAKKTYENTQKVIDRLTNKLIYD